VLTIEQIRRVAQQSGARDITKVEADIILTYLLQLIHEKGITEHVAFKGGTMLRKMIFGLAVASSGGAPRADRMS
jgi:predicted nucleotidyltransferase component of viral defense system